MNPNFASFREEFENLVKEGFSGPTPQPTPQAPPTVKKRKKTPWWVAPAGVAAGAAAMGGATYGIGRMGRAAARARPRYNFHWDPGDFNFGGAGAGGYRAAQEAAEEAARQAAKKEAWEFFGVKPGAVDEMKKAYRERMKKAHPDVGGSRDEAAKINEMWDRIKMGSLLIKMAYKLGII